MTFRFELSGKKIALVLLLVVVLVPALALATVAGTVTRWVANMLVFDGSSGSNAFTFDVDGLRGDFGTGANDYLASNGTSIVCGTTLDSTCVTPTAPAAPPYSVQFNNAGAFGGASNVLIDGGNLVLVGLPAHPPAPGGANHAIVYDWLAQTGMPVQPLRIDNALGIPMAEGQLKEFSLLGTAANWKTTCCVPRGFGNGTIDEVGMVSAAVCSGNGSQTNPTWASTNLYTRSPVVEFGTPTGAAGIWGALFVNGLHFWRGNSAGAGGFLWWARIYFETADNFPGTHRMFVGIINRATILSANAAASGFPNTVYFGANNWENTIRICSSSAITYGQCTDLGSNFPIITDASYDLYLWAKPNDSVVNYGIVRLDSAQTATGTISAPLPVNTAQLTWQVAFGTGGGSQQDGGNIGGTGDGGIQRIGISSVCTAWNY